MAALSTQDRAGIRAVADGEELTKATRRRLVELGHIEPGRGKARLTAKGRAAHEQIMDSGDGPEALKEMFRF